MKKVLIATLAAAATFGLSGMALAFHDGGVAKCEGCHTMHNSLKGAVMASEYALYNTGPYLLQGTDPSSACLNCHSKSGNNTPSSYQIATNAALGAGESPKQRTPGGDFAWLKKTYSWVSRGNTAYSYGERHGHNIVAADNGYVVDGTLATSPGGTYAANKFHCSSCHDPHGKYRILDGGSIVDGTATSKPIAGSSSYGDEPGADHAVGVFRILGGNGYSPKSLGGAHTFSNNPPVAVAPSTYNQSEATNMVRVAYGQGMSEWCANCHGDLLEGAYVSGNANHTHPAGNSAALGALAANYDKYVKTAELSGNNGNSYNSLVPFEMQDATLANLKASASNTNGVLTGPDNTNDNVMCLSCHRAHASGFDSMLRWDGDTLLTYGSTYNGSTDTSVQRQGRTEAEYVAAYYDRPASAFAVDQRSLCNKCHIKD